MILVFLNPGRIASLRPSVDPEMWRRPVNKLYIKKTKWHKTTRTRAVIKYKKKAPPLCPVMIMCHIFPLIRPQLSNYRRKGKWRQILFRFVGSTYCQKDQHAMRAGGGWGGVRAGSQFLFLHFLILVSLWGTSQCKLHLLCALWFWRRTF